RLERIDGIDDRGSDVLELVRDDVAEPGKPQRAADVVVVAYDHAVRDRSGWTRGVWIEHRQPVAHGPRGEAEHPTELAAAEQADRRGRRDRQALHAEATVDVGDPGLL